MPGKKKTADTPPAPPINLDTLTVTDAPAPARASSANGRENPFTAHVQASWEARTQTGAIKSGDEKIPVYKGAGKSVTVDRVYRKQIENMIRYAGNAIGVGTAIVATDKPGGKVEIRFCAKTRRGARKRTNTTAAK